MNRIFHVGPALSVLTVVLAVAACGPTGQSLTKQSVKADITGLVLDRSQAPTLVYKRPGAPTFASYNRFIIDPVRVDYRDRGSKEISRKDIRRMQNYFNDAVEKELRDGGYTVGTRTQANSMRISFTISDLSVPNAAPNVSVLVAPISISVGEVTVESVFRDALTNRIDAVAVARSKGSRVLNDSPWSTWSDVESAFDDWAKGIRKAVDTAHGR